MTVQIWKCPRCAYEYRSPMKVRAVACHAGHPSTPMALAEGPEVSNKKASKA